jgi:phospholipase/carboxylesterase
MHQYKIIEKGKPLDQATKAMILLHGRGGTADGIIDLANEFCDDQFYIAAPQATNNTWYTYSFMEDENMNEPWLSSAVEIVKKLIDNIIVTIPTENIYILGFSQGACLTLEVATRYALPYAGIVAFTGGLIGKEINESRYEGAFGGAKVFIGNSDQDPHVPQKRSEESKLIMEKLGANVHLQIYPGMPHTITVRELNDVKDFMF